MKFVCYLNFTANWIKPTSINRRTSNKPLLLAMPHTSSCFDLVFTHIRKVVLNKGMIQDFFFLLLFPFLSIPFAPNDDGMAHGERKRGESVNPLLFCSPSSRSWPLKIPYGSEPSSSSDSPSSNFPFTMFYWAGRSLLR